MDYQIEHRSRLDATTPARPRLARYLNPGMTCAIALGSIGEGLWFARDPGFAVGGALAGTLIALGILALSLGLAWLAVSARKSPTGQL